MNNDLDSMPEEDGFALILKDFKEDAKIFKKEADKYDGNLIYTLISVAACENYDDEEDGGDEEKYIETIVPDGGQRCFFDFSSAFDAYIECMEKVARRFGYWDWYCQSNSEKDAENSGCLFSCSHDKLEEETAKILSDLGKSESGSFAICDFHARPDSDVNSETRPRDLFTRLGSEHAAGVTYYITLFVTDVKKALEESKTAREDGRSFTEILESYKDYNNFSQETKDHFYGVCLYAEKFEKLLNNVKKSIDYDVLFVRNTVNVSAFEKAGHPYITRCGIARPLFTGFRAAFIDLLSDIFSSVRPFEPGLCARGAFDYLFCNILKPNHDGYMSIKDIFAYVAENMSEENISKYLEHLLLKCGYGGAEENFISVGGDGINEVQIFRNLSICCV